MKTNIIRLVSVISNGAGGPEAGAINMIYTYLLQEYKQDVYSYIRINQIGDDLEEFILKEGKGVHINIRYPVPGFKMMTISEQNLIRLDVVHEALVRIAERERKLDVEILNVIKNRILEQQFLFDFVYKSCINRVETERVGCVIVSPTTDRFDFSLSIIDKGIKICRVPIYSGKPTDYYFADLFSTCKWKGVNQFIVSGKRKEMEIRLNINEKSIEFVNTSGFKAGSPFFELMRADENGEQAWQNYLDSLPPAYAAFLANQSD